MAQLDVSDIIADPLFMESERLAVTRQGQAVGNNGRAQVTPQTLYMRAVVQPGGGDLLQMLPEAERAVASITVWTKFRLNVPTAGRTADIVTWRGDPYMVRLIDPYANFGAGYVRALCTGTNLLNSIDPDAPA